MLCFQIDRANMDMMKKEVGYVFFKTNGTSRDEKYR